MPCLASRNIHDATIQRQSIPSKVVVVQEAEATPQIRPIDSPPVKEQRFHVLICVLEPYVCVEMVVLAYQAILVNASHLPRNLNETWLGLIHGEEDGVEGVRTSRLDLEAVLFVRSPVLQAKPREVGHRQLALGVNVLAPTCF